MTTTPAKAALIAGVLSLAGLAVAQAAPPPAPTAAAPEAAAKGERRIVIKRGGPDGMRMRVHRDPEARAQRLRDVLQLTPQQEPALQAYLTAGKPEMRMERRERPAPDAPRPAPLTTPERLDKQLERMAKRQEAFAKRAAATKTFYAQLTAPQKKAFDALGMGRGDGPRMRGFRHGPGPMAMSDIVVGSPEEHIVTGFAPAFDLAALDDEAFGDVVIIEDGDF